MRAHAHTHPHTDTPTHRHTHTPTRTHTLLALEVTSILTYGLAIWGETLMIEKYRRKMAAVNRLSAIRVSSTVRTVSTLT